MNASPSQPAARPVWSSSCAILPSDFSKSTTDPVRNEWNAGKLRHVIAALGGVPVAVVTDNGTGHTEIGVSLVGLTAGMHGDLVVIERTLSNGKTTQTAFNPWKLGVIIPLPSERISNDAKWRALELHRKECSAAVSKFQQTPTEGASRYEAASGANSVTVSAYDCNGRQLAYRTFRLDELN